MVSAVAIMALMISSSPAAAQSNAAGNTPRFDARAGISQPTRTVRLSDSVHHASVLPDSVRKSKFETGAKIGIVAGIVSGIAFAASYSGDEGEDAPSFGERFSGGFAGAMLMSFVLGSLGALIGSLIH
jgi:hypothetical protein